MMKHLVVPLCRGRSVRVATRDPDTRCMAWREGDPAGDRETEGNGPRLSALLLAGKAQVNAWGKPTVPATASVAADGCCVTRRLPPVLREFRFKAPVETSRFLAPAMLKLHNNVPLI